MSLACAPATLTSSGRLVRLLAMTAADIDFDADVAPALARTARFAGQAPGAYSVAQHSVIGAQALLSETRRVDLALAFLLHDAHEAYLGDITRPAIAALDAVTADLARAAGAALPDDPGLVERAATRIRAGIDAAIHEAAGCPLPSGEVAAAVATMDRRMLATELRQLFGGRHVPPELRELPPVRMEGHLRAWTWPHAADHWITSLRRWGGATFAS